MKLAGKILVASVAALGMIGSGFAAWNYVSNGAAKVTQEVTPTTSGTVELQAKLLEVTPSNNEQQLVLVPGSEQQLGLSYNVKYKGSEFKGNEQLTVKVEANKDVSNYLSLPAEIEVAPSIWHNEENAATGYEVELEFAWVVGETEVTDLLGYAKEHYPTTAAQQGFLAPYETAIQGVTFTITFDIEYGELPQQSSEQQSSEQQSSEQQSSEQQQSSQEEPVQENLADFALNLPVSNTLEDPLSGNGEGFTKAYYALKEVGKFLKCSLNENEVPTLAQTVNITVTGVGNGDSGDSIVTVDLIDEDGNAIDGCSQTFTPDKKSGLSTKTAVDNAKTDKTVQIAFNPAMRGVKVTLTVRAQNYVITNLAIAYE